jgi:hypothetical protein
MFSRIRFAAHVIATPVIRVPDHAVPDIVFKDVGPQELTRASKAVAKVLEVLLIACVIGFSSAKLLVFLFARQHAIVGVAASVSSILTFVLYQFYDRFNTRLLEYLKVSERLAPYVGHRLAKTFHVLRG